METRAEENMKVFHLETGRTVAALSRGTADPGAPGPSFMTLASTEKRVASVLNDGSIQIHELEWRSFNLLNDAPIVILPRITLVGFRGHHHPRARAMTFSHDASLLMAIGNLRQLKLWVVAGETTSASNQGQETYADYLMEHELTCLCGTPNPQEEGGEIVVGDVTGRVVALRLIVAQC
jgi:hypothetical protein